VSAPTRRPAVGRILLGATVAATVLFLLAPLLIVIPISFSDSTLMQFPPKGFSLRWYHAYFDSASWIAASWMSLEIGLTVAVASTALGTAAALGLSRARFRGRAAVQAFMLSPLVMPVIILSIGLYYVYAFVGLNGTVVGLVIGHVVLTVPYATVVIGAALEDFDRRLEQAAQGLGAAPLVAFRRIALPLIGPSVAIAFLFGFLTSFDEVVLAIFLTGPETMTLPRKMWDGIRFELNPTIAAVSTMLIALSWGLFLVAGLLRRRREPAADTA
jgi:putative spermidine/putrescine transport system permease protein